MVREVEMEVRAVEIVEIMVRTQCPCREDLVLVNWMTTRVVPVAEEGRLREAIMEDA